MRRARTDAGRAAAIGANTPKIARVGKKFPRDLVVDRREWRLGWHSVISAERYPCRSRRLHPERTLEQVSVSYTHLTLPTICSV